VLVGVRRTIRTAALSILKGTPFWSYASKELMGTQSQTGVSAMSALRSASLISTVILLGFCSSAAARPVDDWSDQKLTKRADAILIGAPTSSEDEPADRSNAKPDSWVGVNTKFHVAAILKGKLKEDEITFLHQRYFGGEKVQIETIDGPNFVKFDPRAGTKYLLFLKRLDDGRFEPVSGQYDPDLSLKVIQDYAEPSARAADKH
jgi:hypothetical protein